MTSHRRRSLKVRQAGEKRWTSSRGRKKLDFENMSKQNLPLDNKSIYIDIKNGKQTDLMEEQLKKLGAKIERFLSREVNYVISTSGPTKVDEKQGNWEESQTSPSFGNVPSPFSCGPSPTGQTESKKAVVSRGKALAQIACSKNKASTVVASAEKLGIKVVSVDVAHKWLERELKKLETENKKTEGNKKENKAKKTKPPRKDNATKSKILKTCFIKFEASNQHYKPVKSEFDHWPRLNLSAPPGICPFGEARLKVQHQYGPRRAEPVLPSKPAGPQAAVAEENNLPIKPEEMLPVQPPSAVPECVAVPIVATGDVKRNLNFRSKKNNPNNKQQGYCDCCEIKFKDIDQHINGEEHKTFARDKTNYESLDILINSMPSTIKFLQSILLKHCAQMQNETLGDGICHIVNSISVAPPVSPLTTEKFNPPSQEIAALSLYTPQQCEPDASLSRDPLMQTDTDLISKREITPTEEEKAVDNRPQAVVIRRPVPSGIFTSPRRRQPTPSKKPWVQERSMVFRDSPIASLQPSVSNSSKSVYNDCSGFEPKNLNLVYSDRFGAQNSVELGKCSGDLKTEDMYENKQENRSLQVLSTSGEGDSPNAGFNLAQAIPCSKKSPKTSFSLSKKFSVKTVHDFKKTSYSSRTRHSLTFKKIGKGEKKLPSGSKCNMTSDVKTEDMVDSDIGCLSSRCSPEVISTVKEIVQKGHESVLLEIDERETQQTDRVHKSANKCISEKSGESKTGGNDETSKSQNQKVVNVEPQPKDNLDMNEVVIPCIADRVKQRCRQGEPKKHEEKGETGKDMDKISFTDTPGESSVMSHNKDSSPIECKENLEVDAFCHKLEGKEKINGVTFNCDEKKEEIPLGKDDVEELNSLTEKHSSPCQDSNSRLKRRQSRVQQSKIFKINSEKLDQSEGGNVTTSDVGQGKSKIIHDSRVKKDKNGSESPNSDNIEKPMVVKTRRHIHQRSQSLSHKEVLHSGQQEDVEMQRGGKDNVVDQQEKVGIKMEFDGSEIELNSKSQSCHMDNKSGICVTTRRREKAVNHEPDQILHKDGEATQVSRQSRGGRPWSATSRKKRNVGQQLHNPNTSPEPVSHKRALSLPRNFRNKQRGPPDTVVDRNDRYHFDKRVKSVNKTSEKCENGTSIGELKTGNDDLKSEMPEETADHSSHLLPDSSVQHQETDTSPSENIAKNVKCKSRFCKQFIHEGTYANNGEGSESMTMGLQENSNIESVVPNIADCVKSRSRIKYDTEQTLAGNVDSVRGRRKAHRKLKKIKCERKGGNFDEMSSRVRKRKQRTASLQISRTESFGDEKEEEDHEQPCLKAIPNIAESVKKRRSCTMFNHEGQYANNGEGDVVLECSAKDVDVSNSHQCKQKHCRSRNNTTQNSCVENDYSAHENHGFESGQSQQSLVKSGSESEQSSHKGDEKSSDRSPAVVIRRKKPVGYPSFTGKLRPEVDWGKYHSKRDWSVADDSEDDGNGAHKDRKDTISVSSKEPEEKSATFRQDLCPPDGKNLDLSTKTSRKSRLSRYALVTSAGYEGGGIIDGKEQTSKNNSTKSEQCSLKNSCLRKGSVVTPASPRCAANSPRLMLKIRRNLDNDEYSSTWEERTDNVMSSENIQTPPKYDSVQYKQNKCSQPENTTQLKKNAKCSPGNSESATGSGSVDLLQSSPHPVRLDKKKEFGSPQFEVFSDSCSVELLSEHTPKSKKRGIRTRRLEYGKDSPLGDTISARKLSQNVRFLENEASENVLLHGLQAQSPSKLCRAQSPCFHSPVSIKSFKSHQTPQKIVKALSSEKSECKSPVFNRNLRDGQDLCEGISEVNKNNQLRKRENEMSPASLKNAGLEAKVLRNESKRSEKSKHNSGSGVHQVKGDHFQNNQVKRNHSSSELTSPPPGKRIKLDNTWNLASDRSLAQLLNSDPDSAPFDGFHAQSNQDHLSNVTFVQASEVDMEEFSDSGWIIDDKKEECQETENDDTAGSNISSEAETLNGVSEGQEEPFETEELLGLVPTFSSPGKITDSSWGDICDSYLSKTISKNGQHSPQPHSLQGSKRKKNAPMSPFKQLEHLSSPDKSISQKSDMASKSVLGNVESGAFPLNVNMKTKRELTSPRRGLNKETERGKHMSGNLNQHGYNTPVKRQSIVNSGLSPSIQRVDNEISFNFSSPQRVNCSPVRIKKICSPLKKSLFSPSKKS